MTISHKTGNENYTNRAVDTLYNANWKKIAKYGVSAAAGAAILGFAGHEFGRDIADLFVESKMGMERAIVGDLIAKASPYVGGVMGTLAAYILNKNQKNK